ncbi:hypothetical protein ACIRVK_32065 [Streptomyces sp. NPDC101152]|uniref:hypothetical protein n=1 Tax=Streptomyces sp. NPDC101152 TaxID=3366116 RepID=UPI0037F144CC
MSETTVTSTELTSQYSTQVAGDLERNLKEQQRLHGEIEALQAQLAALQQDHTVLVNIQQALGVPAAPAQPAPEAVTATPTASVPAARKKATGASRAAKKPATVKKPATARKRTGKKAAATAPVTSSAAPKLVDLVREQLGGQSEPRSAAEITASLEQQHPERTIKTTVVRTTLEGLVAKNQAQRTRQGRSVYYTTPDAAQSAPQDEPQAEQSA